MGVFLADMNDDWDAERITRHGMWAAIGFIVMGVLSLGIFAMQYGLIGFRLLTLTNLGLAVIAGTVTEMVAALVAAIQFSRGRGVVSGIVLLLLFIADTIIVVMNVFPGILGIVLRVAILFGLINGIRGAMMLRGRPAAIQGDLAETFG